MVDAEAGRRRVRVTASVIVEVTDESALESEALEHVDTAEYFVVEGSGLSVDEVRAAEREAVLGDPVAAIETLVDPFDLMESVRNVESLEAECQVREVDENGYPLPSTPDFGELFQVCGCGQSMCDECESATVTPRTAAALWIAGQLLADFAYDDVLEYGDLPVETTGTWAVFDQFPRITWKQNAVWRRQAARSFDDLVADLESGDWPQPRCPAEEMALHLMFRFADDTELQGGLASLPEHEDDLDWTLLYDVLFQDLDILDLFEAGLDGIEDPNDDQNRFRGMGDYTPGAWFVEFLDKDARDPRRPFRR
jgi:hypothetical protein